MASIVETRDFHIPRNELFAEVTNRGFLAQAFPEFRDLREIAPGFLRCEFHLDGTPYQTVARMTERAAPNRAAWRGETGPRHTGSAEFTALSQTETRLEVGGQAV